MSSRAWTILVCLLLAAAGCGPNQRILESSNANTSNVETTPVADSGSNSNAPATFEQDLQAMRTADFKIIVAFRRKDGQPLDAADKDLISRNTALQANRRRLSDEGRAVIIGTNFPIEAKFMKELSDRFTMENYSSPDSGPITFDPSPLPTNGVQRQ